MAKAPTNAKVRRSTTEQVLETEQETVETVTPVADVVDTSLIDGGDEIATETVAAAEAIVIAQTTLDDSAITAADAATAADATTTLFKVVIGDMHNYIAEMAPNVQQTPQSGAVHQITLFRNFQRLFKLGDQEFIRAMNEILDLFANSNNVALQKDMPYRFVQNINLPQDQRALFTRLVHLFQDASDRALRGAVAQRTNLNDIARLLGDERSGQRLMAFFAR